ncbi:MAG: excinuclease ABC subunit UvrA, partial [Woeseiaceae bacterium]
MGSTDPCIRISGARTHNLCNLDLDLPRNKLIVFTGLSGSGKSSLAFDTIYAEGQRRYVESLSAYARQFLSMMEKPDIDHIDGLSPASSIEQKSTSHNPRSTVGTVTEIYDYLRLLYARAGSPRCPDHDTNLEAQTVSQMVDQVMAMPEGTRLMMLAPVVDNRKGEHVQLMADLMAQGFIRARIDGEVYELDQPPTLDLRKKHTIEAIVDRFRVKPDTRLRLAESFETTLRLADGVARIAWMDDTDREELVFSDRFACNICRYSLAELEPRLFSFNNPSGACPSCDGLGVKQFFDPDRVVVNRSLSLAGGAIRGWDRKTTYYYQMIQSLAAHYGFDIETRFENLPANMQEIVLYGSGSEKVEFHYANSRGMQIKKLHRFEGVIPNLDRRYRETESGAVREELTKFLNSQDCPECRGTRLNRSARHVFITDKSLPEITNLSVGHARAFFETMKLEGWRATIADKIVKEIGDRLGFLSDVGLDY